jgi:hypothetical protein
MVIEVSSSAFEPDGTIPAKHTGESQDVSPPLERSELPEGTKEVALISATTPTRPPTDPSSTGWCTKSPQTEQDCPKVARKRL